MFTFLKVVAALAKYGQRAVSFAWAHKSEILRMIERNLAISAIIQWVKNRLGI